VTLSESLNQRCRNTELMIAEAIHGICLVVTYGLKANEVMLSKRLLVATVRPSTETRLAGSHLRKDHAVFVTVMALTEQ